MKIKQIIIQLKNYKRDLELSEKILENFKLKSDETRSIDDTIGYLRKEKVKINYRINR